MEAGPFPLTLFVPLTLAWSVTMASQGAPSQDAIVRLWPAAAYQHAGAPPGSHPLGPEAGGGLAWWGLLLACLGPDPALSHAFLTGLLNVVTVLVLGTGLARHGYRSASVLAAGLSFTMALVWADPSLPVAAARLAAALVLVWTLKATTLRAALAAAVALGAALGDASLVLPLTALATGWLWERYRWPPGVAAAIWTAAACFWVQWVDTGLTRLENLGLPAEALVEPLTLRRWLAWRGLDHGWTPEDLALARVLGENDLVLTPGLPHEPLVPAALLATVSGRALAGWHADPPRPELYPLAEAVRRTGLTELLEDADLGSLRLRGGSLPRLEPPSEAGELPRRTAPGELLWWAGGYQLQRAGRPWGSPVRGTPLAPLPVPLTPGSYSLQDATFDVPERAPRLELVAGSLETRTATVVGVTARLVNHGPERFASAAYQGLVLETGEQRLLHPLPSLVLAPGEGADLRVQLAAPSATGDFLLTARLLAPWGSLVPVRCRLVLTVAAR